MTSLEAKRIESKENEICGEDSKGEKKANNKSNAAKRLDKLSEKLDKVSIQNWKNTMGESICHGKKDLKVFEPMMIASIVKSHHSKRNCVPYILHVPLNQALLYGLK